jgi:hypothetical protein
MADSRTYHIRGTITNPGAVSMVQLKAVKRSFLITEASVEQIGSNATAQLDIDLIMQTTAATGTAFTPVLANDGDPAATTTALVNCTAEGTAGTVRQERNPNILNGYYYLPTPQNQERFDDGSFVNLKFNAAPPASTYAYEITICEA